MKLKTDTHITAQAIRYLLAFFVIAFGWSWLLWAGAAHYSTLSPGLAAILHIGATFGPLIATVIVIVATRGLKDLLSWLRCRFRPNAPKRYYVLAFLLPPLLMSIACLLHVALGGSLREPPVIHHWWKVPLNFMLIFLFGGPLGEELGWRGFALPAMQQRIGPWFASAALGVIWSVWHLPLFFISGTVQYQLPFWLFVLNAVPLAMLLGWLFNKTGRSIVPVMILHMGINGWAALIPVLPAGDSIRPFVIATTLLWLAAFSCLSDKQAGYVSQ
ncbi:MAG TPA: type II CAAX endopeptidase family protein [Noviherbaspirillum sp.]|nr:type II CAAX endopeptidase family protein [Noviherbaspirillum sp.]